MSLKKEDGGVNLKKEDGDVNPKKKGEEVKQEAEDDKAAEEFEIRRVQEEKFKKKRQQLVESLKRLEVDEKVLRALLLVPRHSFVPEYMREAAYVDSPLVIGCGQTISAPHMVAIMCSLLELSKGQKVLEIGAGSGYNAAVMAELVGENGHVYTVERIKALVDFAKKNLKSAGYENVTVLLEDGSLGCPEFAPYDRICVTCAAPTVPSPLIEQLKLGGLMAIPVGSYFQELIIVKKDSKGKVSMESKGGVVFVPLIGKYGFK